MDLNEEPQPQPTLESAPPGCPLRRNARGTMGPVN